MSTPKMSHVAKMREAIERYRQHERIFSLRYQPKEKRLLLSLNKTKSAIITQTEKSFFKQGKYQIKYETYEFDNTVVVLKTRSRRNTKIKKKLAQKFEKKIDGIQKRKKCYIDYSDLGFCAERFVRQGKLTFADFLLNASAFLDTYKDTIPPNTKRLYWCLDCYHFYAKCNAKCLCHCTCYTHDILIDDEIERNKQEEE